MRYAGIWVQVFQKIEYQGARTQQVTVFGADDRYMEIQGGTLLRGRFFSRAELTGEPVIVLESAVADRLFGRLDPLGKQVRIGGRSFRVIGDLREAREHLRAAGPGDRRGGPVRDRAGAASSTTRPTPCSSRSSRGAGSRWAARWTRSTVALRRARGTSGPATPNTFDLITQDQILDVIGNFTSYFFLAMVALSSVALLVGGIGVMAIMMVSVTDRTKEIGLRKALGATRREMLWQFLVEAATLTLLGGAARHRLRARWPAMLLKAAMGLESAVPLWSIVLACGVSIGIGLVFGLLPANRAARMDPVEALRHE